MAHTAADGRGFTNRSDMKRHDRKTTVRPTDQRNASPEEPEDMNDNDGAAELLEDNMENPSGADMAEQHGPAHKVVIQHDESSGMHMVHTDHPDGHSMMTQHGTAEAAHQYGKDCAGA